MTSIARNGITTTNAEGAKTFYGDLFGWEFGDGEIPGGVYESGAAVGAIDQSGSAQ